MAPFPLLFLFSRWGTWDFSSCCCFSSLQLWAWSSLEIWVSWGREGRGAREGERAPRPCAIRPQPRGPGSVTETQLPRTCISALTQPGPRKSSLTPTTPLGPRSALLLTLLILSPNISGSGCSLPPSPPTHTLRGNLLAAQLHSPAGRACGPSDHPLVLRTWPGGAFHRPACGDQEGGVSTKRQSSEPSWDVNHRGEESSSTKKWRLSLGLGGDPTICPEQDFLTRAQVLGGIYKP